MPGHSSDEQDGRLPRLSYLSIWPGPFDKEVSGPTEFLVDLRHLLAGEVGLGMETMVPGPAE
jgi:hypothetical protein